MTRRRLIILLILIATTLIVGAIVVVKRIERRVDEAYALMMTNYLIIDYVCGHEGRWPHGWADLTPTSGIFVMDPEPDDAAIAELREIVGVNWDLDLAVLLGTPESADRSAFQTTYLLSGNEFQWQEPTEQIYYGIREQLELMERDSISGQVEAD